MNGFFKSLCGAAALSIAVAAGLAAGPARAAQDSGAIGQIVPRGGVIALVGAPGAVVGEVRVRPGDNVRAGAVLMTLAGEAVSAERELAARDLQSARTITAAQVSAQSLAVDITRQRLEEATRQVSAYRALGASTAANELARLESAQTQARLALEIEQARLRAANAEAARTVLAAEKRLELANAAAEIRAPGDGTILRVDRRPGQRLAGEPAIMMGDLSVMYVTSQVYEGDLLTLRPGMIATIRSAALAQPLTGVVEEVSRLVDTRARLGEIRIKLDSVEPANRLVGMEVEVVIAR